MKKTTSLILAAVVLLGGVIGSKILRSSPPEVKERPKQETVAVVEAISIEKTDYQLRVPSYGRVVARTQSLLTAEVPGKITSIGSAFRVGGQFRQGDVLVTVEGNDYRSQIDLANAQLEQAKLAYQQEVAQSQQAKRNWDRLALDRTPSDLVLRKPYLASAKAAVQSAQAQHKLAQQNLSRTQIRAPFAGKVLKKNVDIGQVVSSNTALGEIYQSGHLEVRLPIPADALNSVDLPEDVKARGAFPKVEIFNNLPNGKDTWMGTVVLSEGAIDTDTQQLYVVAEIDANQVHAPSRELKLNQYVEAEILGKHLYDVAVIPASLLNQGRFVYVLENGVVQKREVKVISKSGETAVLESGLEEGELLITSVVTDALVGRSARLPETKKVGNNAAGKRQAKNEGEAKPEGESTDEEKGERKEKPIPKSASLFEQGSKAINNVELVV